MKVEPIVGRRVWVEQYGRWIRTHPATVRAFYKIKSRWAVAVQVDAMPGLVYLRLQDGYEVQNPGDGWHLKRQDRVKLQNDINKLEEKRCAT